MEEDEFKVSIITVVYNGVETIEQTILSVLGQTYKNIEYIVIDGLSTDGTKQVIEKYSKAISHFVSEKDNGIYDAMNKGIALSTGNVIGIINSDDWYSTDAVEKVVKFLKHNTVDLVYGRVFQVYPDNSETLAPLFPLDSLWYRMAVPHPSVFIKKSIYEKFGAFCLDYKLSADYELMLRLYSQQVRFGFVDAVLAYFRCGGLSEKFRKKGVEEDKIILAKYMDACPNREMYQEKFKDLCEWEHFFMEMKNTKGFLPALLKAYFKESKIVLIIFGAGRRGKRCYDALRDDDIDLRLFIDNNPKKWNQKLGDIRIVSPQEGSHLNAKILISVQDNGDNIKKQLKEITNNRIECVSLKDLKDMFVSRM